VPITASSAGCDIRVIFGVYYCIERACPACFKDCNQMKNKRILLVEDEKDIADLLALHLKDLCNELCSAADGHEGMRRACSEHWDLVVLDLRLPGPDGLEICRALRRLETYTPILMLTSKSSELDRVLGLELGADDYMIKPFSVLELMARVKAIFRRVDALENDQRTAEERIRVGSIEIEPDSRAVTVNDRQIELTAREFDLLLHFARHPGRVFRRSELLDRVWGLGHEGYEHTVNSHINRLRAKIEPDPADPTCIVTVWGVGYKLASRQSSVMSA